jgi:hypothetical protein
MRRLQINTTGQRNKLSLPRIRGRSLRTHFVGILLLTVLPVLGLDNTRTFVVAGVVVAVGAPLWFFITGQRSSKRGGASGSDEDSERKVHLSLHFDSISALFYRSVNCLVTLFWSAICRTKAVT